MDNTYGYFTTKDAPVPVTIEDIKVAMEKMKAIRRVRPTVVQCLNKDREVFLSSFEKDGKPNMELLTYTGIEVRFYKDEGEMAKDSFELINDGNSVIQIG